MTTPASDAARPAARLVDVRTAAEMLGVSRSNVYELMAADDLESVKIGRRRLVIVSSIDALVDRLRARAA